jgi:hypothetical protein
LYRATVAQALHLPFLENAEKFWLQFERKVSNLVQKQGSAIGGLEAPCGLSYRASERASFMSKQFALQQSARNRRAIYGYKAIPAARAGFVDRLCYDLFASAGLSLNQDGGIYRRNHVYLVKHTSESWAGSDQFESRHR